MSRIFAIFGGDMEMKDEEKKTSDQTTGEKSDKALTDEELDNVAGGKSVIIQNRSSEGPNIGGIV